MDEERPKRFGNSNVRQANSVYKSLRENAEKSHPPTLYNRIDRDQAHGRHADNLGNSKHRSLQQLPHRDRNKPLREQLVAQLIQQKNQEAELAEARFESNNLNLRKIRHVFGYNTQNKEHRSRYAADERVLPERQSRAAAAGQKTYKLLTNRPTMHREGHSPSATRV